mgnify:CR=1 FL=1|tara:strand:+ start:3919 stop:4980 length:1062 start_codon:yes stop_codon:yes gene_type:complete
MAGRIPQRHGAVHSIQTDSKHAMSKPALSVLDLAPVTTDTPPSVALRRTVDLALLAERCGYARYWFAEHHSLGSVASSAPEILIAHVASHTKRIRVGSGGIMLPNHAPLRVAEAFQTLAALYPGRIDLGIGRAPGSDRAASMAMRAADGEHFSQLMTEMLALSRGKLLASHPLHSVTVMPTDVPLPPVWILGSSGASAASAGAAGFGYGFASHFSPAPPGPALNAYRSSFKPSDAFPEPHAVLAVAVVCADTQEEAEDLALSMELTWLRITRGEFLPLPSREEARAYPWTDVERESLRRQRGPSIVGTPDLVQEQLQAMAAECGANELMVVSNISDHAARLRSYELLGQAFAQ